MKYVERFYWVYLLYLRVGETQLCLSNSDATSTFLKCRYGGERWGKKRWSDTWYYGDIVNIVDMATGSVSSGN